MSTYLLEHDGEPLRLHAQNDAEALRLAPRLPGLIGSGSLYRYSASAVDTPYGANARDAGPALILVGPVLSPR